MIVMKGQDSKQEHNIADRLARLESSLLNLSLICLLSSATSERARSRTRAEPDQEQELASMGERGRFGKGLEATLKATSSDTA